MIWPFKRKKPVPVQEPEPETADTGLNLDREAAEAARIALAAYMQRLQDAHPTVVTPEGAMDSCAGSELTEAAIMSNDAGGAGSEALFLWYASQTFIGHQMCSVLSQNWLINKACMMPGRDAVRQGYEIKTESGEPLPDEAIRLFRKYDKRFRINAQMVQHVHLGRIFGLRIAFAKIKSSDPDYYEKPFNPDGITAGSYRGIVQVDPYWCAPLLDAEDVADPDSLHFYEPKYWMINGRRYHRSHLIIYRTGDLPDLLKPTYLYGGIPVPQLIMERVYAAERTANEGPSLALSKRTTLLKLNMGKAFSNEGSFIQRIRSWSTLWSNFGIKVIDGEEEEEVQQFDTSLADFDTLIMTQYQLVAAEAEVPATKLLGTTPKGFNATGEYDESSYHESLESIQTHDLTPLIERHHLCVMRSYIWPQLRGRVDIHDLETYVDWAPLDSPTMKEYAEIEEIQSRTAANYSTTGAVDQYDIRESIISNKHSMFHGLTPAEAPDVREIDNDDDADEDRTVIPDPNPDEKAA